MAFPIFLQALLLLLSVVDVTHAYDELFDGDSGTKVADWMEKVDRLLLQQDKRLRQLEQENRELKARNRDLEDRLLALENLRNPDAVAEKKAKVMLSYQAMKSRDLVTRSDDVQPLEPVVAQMSQRLTEVSAEVQALKNTNTHQDAAIQEAGSSVYVRWGRSVCPNSTHLVYSGVIGGSYYNHDGAASNVLCLTMSPVFSNHAIPAEHSMLYGGEYETWDSHYQKDPVCAVCRSQRPTTIMVPGTNVCMPGWTLEYSGFLMANHYAYKAGTDYICVDSALENRVGGDANQNGVLLHYTATVCGSLPCSPYVNNKVVTCAVCSQ